MMENSYKVTLTKKTLSRHSPAKTLTGHYISNSIPVHQLLNVKIFSDYYIAARGIWKIHFRACVSDADGG